MYSFIILRQNEFLRVTVYENFHGGLQLVLCHSTESRWAERPVVVDWSSSGMAASVV